MENQSYKSGSSPSVSNDALATALSFIEAMVAKVLEEQKLQTKKNEQILSRIDKLRDKFVTKEEFGVFVEDMTKFRGVVFEDSKKLVELQDAVSDLSSDTAQDAQKRTQRIGIVKEVLKMGGAVVVAYIAARGGRLW